MVQLETSIKKIVYYVTTKVSKDKKEESFKGEKLDQNNSDEDIKVLENRAHFNRDEIERNLPDSDEEEWKDGGEGESDEDHPSARKNGKKFKVHDSNDQASQNSTRKSRSSKLNGKKEK